MESELDDEVVSNNAIYGPETLSKADADGAVYILKVPGSAIALRLQFPENYPHAAPQILGPEAAGPNARKGQANEAVQAARSALQACFREGEPCIFEVIELLQGDPVNARADIDMSGNNDATYESHTQEDDVEADRLRTSVPYVDPQWTVSDVVTEKKSVFVARCAKVESPAQARQFIQHLVTTDKKASKATHNITAWRIRGPEPEVSYNDCDDDGETAAGGRLLHLLQLMEVWNVLVVVSRWYGGTHLGPDRFKVINNVARDALTRSGVHLGGS